jgi:hypothetical protein
MDRATIQEQLDEVSTGELDDERVAMDEYYRDLQEENRQAQWEEMNRYEQATGLTFVCEAHFEQHMAYHSWLGEQE